MQQCIYWSFLSSTCFGRIRPSSVALDVKFAALRTTTHLQTECRKPHAATLTSSAPDDGRMRPKHVELKKLQ